MTAELLAVILPALGCLLAGVAAGRAWGRAGLDDAEARAYERGWNDRAERDAIQSMDWAEARDAKDCPRCGDTYWDLAAHLIDCPADILSEDEGPLVPLPDRLPDADTLTRMYATLGDQEASDEARQRPGQRLHKMRKYGMDARGGDLARGGAGLLVPDGDLLGLPAGPVTLWDSDAPAERVPTIAELAEDAEYRLCWAELGAMRDSARAWYAETFSTGTLPAVR